MEKRLGKGLNALIPERANATSPNLFKRLGK